MKRKILLSLVALSTILCVGCKKENNNSKYDSHVMIDITHATNNAKVITPDKVKLADTYYSLHEKQYYNTQVIPSTGKVKILVIPMLMPGYTTIDINADGNDDKLQVREDLQKAFFAKESETYESVSSFYKKSSFNKLHLSGYVTEWYDVGANSEYTNASQIDYYDTYSVVQEAVEWVKDTQNIDIADYDSDMDGYIDGVFCIYSCPNYTNGGPHTDYGNYWAYTAWGNQTEDGGQAPSIENPVYNLYGWASYDFMYEEYGFKKIDARTYIHEMGHFLGLNDYYSDHSSYNPVGKVDMMDANIIDHNSYSKMLLGWTKPYVVTGNAKIDLQTMCNENSLIVIPSDSTVIENNTFDPFSEYILIELYTNDGLNYQDSKTQYGNTPLAMSSKGVRIYHIDNRKFVIDETDIFNPTCKEYVYGDLLSDSNIVLPITNYRSSDVYNTYFNLDVKYNLYDEIRLIEATNVDTFSNGGKQTSKTLFKENDVFTLEKYGPKFFVNNNLFNNGDTFTYQVKIGEVK